MSNQPEQIALDMVAQGAEQLRYRLADKFEEEIEPLDEEEIEIAVATVTKMHPLYYVPVYRILPWLCCCQRMCRRESRYAEEGETKEITEHLEEVKEMSSRLDQIIFDAHGT